MSKHMENKMIPLARCAGNHDDKVEITWGLQAARVQITDRHGVESDIIIDRELAMQMFEWLTEQMNNY